MDYTEETDRFVIRLDPGDEVLESLATVREEASVTGGFFTGIGAVDRVTLGHYDVEAQEYHEETFEGEFEVTAFSGNVGPDKIHAHIQVGERDFSTMGGHCSGARVSGTFEIVLLPTETTLTHRPDDTTGLDVFDI
jgi:hypothetical protein